MSTLSIDFETRSTVNLPKTGVYPYATDPSTEILCLAWAFDDEEPKIWTPSMDWDSDRDRIVAHVARSGAVRAWNAQFERVVWYYIMHKQYGFPALTIEQCYDTAADAAALALPRGLSKAASVLGLGQQKDDSGHRLMMKMCKPRRARKGEPTRGTLWHETPEQLEALYQYCLQDVRTERAVAERIRTLGPHEREVYMMDQRMNDRGVRIDVPLITAMGSLVTEGEARAGDELSAITRGAVTKATQTRRLLEWIEPQYNIPNLRKDVIRDMLADDDDIPVDVRRALEIRAATAKASTAKLASMMRFRCVDDKVRGMFLYHGAGPGRWSGKGPQPQNYPRPTVSGIDNILDGILEGSTYDEILEKHNPLAVVSSGLRSCLASSPGSRFIAGDYGQIEARVLALFAGQDDLVQLFRDGGKVYEEMAAYIYGVPVEQIKNPSEERQTGKNTVLGCGFQMGPETYAEQAKVQTGITIEPEMAERSVASYRERFEMIPLFWREINDAAMRAVHTGETTTVGHGLKVKFTLRGQFLWCILPSGRPLAYAKPEIRVHTVTPKKGEPFETASVMYHHVNSMTKKWEKRYSYGGMWTENVVQAAARDLLASAMLRLEAAGYPPVMTIHDEVVADVPNRHGNLKEFLSIMEDNPQWAKDLPVVAEGWEGQRYRK